MKRTFTKLFRLPSETMAKGSTSSFILHLHPRLIPEKSARFAFTFCFGGLAFFCFIIEVLTGSLLMLHYQPSASGAYASVQKITHIAPYGSVIRNVHYWAGQAMVVLVCLHMIRVFITRSYEEPRRLNWVVGVACLILTVFVDFTGYLLVWDDRALVAWTIARNILEMIPLIGAPAASTIFGTESDFNMAIIRLYSWHIVIFPLIMTFFMSLHFWKIRKDGGISIPL